MEEWINEQLSMMLDFPVPQELIQYILEMQNERDLDEYLKSLLDYRNPKHKQFITELKKKQATYIDQSGYKKTNDNDNVIKKQNDKKKGKAKGKENNAQAQEIVQVEKPDKKKSKFVNLYSQEGNDKMTVLLKGRHKCNCEAKSHKLINNCLNCGRIVCMQENAGPCFFCGQLVCSAEQQTILASNTKQGDNLYNKLMEQKPAKGYHESIQQRDKLLEYDKNSSRRTKIIDDESDYYQSNSAWLSSEQREKLKKQEEKISAQKHASRLNMKMTLDFAGRQFIEQHDFINEDIEEEIYDSPPSDMEHPNICPTIEFHRPIYVDQNKHNQTSKKKNGAVVTRSRIQDKEYLEMTDEGHCLSMHQPYASLLVAGIKVHEGRTWYTSHRGRLWIASTVKIPTVEDISSVQNAYRVLGREEHVFPDQYPTGCLLGCVTVVNCLPQEEYRQLYPDGESDSPYVFICEDPYILPFKFHVRGKHKIYKLEKKIHQAALKSLERAMKTQRT